MRYKIVILVSRRYSAASNSKRQVEVRCNSIFFQTEPGSVGSTKPVTLITKQGCSNSPLETPLETPLLYFKYCQTYLNTSASNKTRKKIRKKERNRKKRNTRNKMK